MFKGKKWKAEDALKKVQEHYNKLAGHYNAKRFDKIADLYNDASTIQAAESKKIYLGKGGAVDFWKYQHDKMWMKNLKFTIDKVKLAPSVRLYPFANAFKPTIQRIGYVGRIEFDIRENDPEVRFSGSGDHMDDCTLGTPDSEHYGI